MTARLGGTCRNVASTLHDFEVPTLLMTQPYGDAAGGADPGSPLEELFLLSSSPLCGRFLAGLLEGDVVLAAADYDFAPRAFSAESVGAILPSVASFSAVISCTDISWDAWCLLRRAASHASRSLYLLMAGWPPPPSFFEWCHGASCVFANESESAAAGAASPEEFCAKALECGAFRAVVTLASRGVCHAYQGQTPRRVSRQSADEEPHVRCTVGAGDAFAAGVVAGMLKSLDPEETIALGLAAALRCIQRPLAG